jgi:protoporphyrinogen oxidase
MRVAVVGAGITGLVVADELLGKGHDVCVYELDEPGGLAGGIPFPGVPGVYLDRYYHHVFTHETDVVELVQKHGLASDLVWRETKSAIYMKGRTWPFRTAGDLLRCAAIGSLWQRFLTGLSLLALKRRTDWRALDAITCREFFERRRNTAAYQNLWEPLLRAKFGDEPDRIPAAFIWGRVRPRARSRTRGREHLGYLRGGFQRLVLAMVESIERRGGAVRAHDAVQRVVPGAKPEVASERGCEQFDRVVWTVAPRLVPEFVPDLDPAVARKALAVEYVAVTCLVLVMKTQQSGFYWLNTLDPDIGFGAIIEHTNLASPADYTGNHVLYVVRYHRQKSTQPQLDAEQMLDAHLPSLSKVLPGFRRQDVVRTHLFHDAFSSPLYDLGYLQRMPPYRGWLDNVDICGMAHVYPQDRNMNSCVRNARAYVAHAYEE